MFYKIAIACDVVICCRTTPKNKARLVELIKEKTNYTTLAIGDGANDVGMIQVGHVVFISALKLITKSFCG
jgi:P-type E1-E2 ATPase